jgi:hypothetical protein
MTTLSLSKHWLLVGSEIVTTSDDAPAAMLDRGRVVLRTKLEDPSEPPNRFACVDVWLENVNVEFPV